MNARIVLTGLLLAFAGLANAQGIEGAPYVAVRGSASQEVAPDTFPLQLRLSETSTNAAGTQARIEKLAAEVLALVQQAGVTEADVTVSNLSISPEHKYNDRTEEQVFLGNRYSREIKVRFHALDKLREFIARLPADKALKLDTSPFLASNADELRRALLDKAISNARATAESLAAGTGRKLGRVHTISNQGLEGLRYSGGFGRERDSQASAGSDGYGAGAMSLREGRITLEQSVYIVYALE